MLFALELVGSEMEDAARILGGSALRTTCRITLPLVAPAILGGAIITFLDTLALFGTPAIVSDHVGCVVEPERWHGGGPIVQLTERDLGEVEPGHPA